MWRTVRAFAQRVVIQNNIVLCKARSAALVYRDESSGSEFQLKENVSSSDKRSASPHKSALKALQPHAPELSVGRRYKLAA